MRMSSEQVELSVKVIRKYFADAAVWLFGSRVDDARKGGDFDFYIETSQADIALLMARARGDLIDSLGMKVDLAVNNHTGDKPIFRIAKSSGVRLA
jgi:predicted nucleotidyltransferase